MLVHEATGAAFMGLGVADGAGLDSRGLPAGDYKPYVYPDEPGYPNQWFGGTSFASAAVVTVDADMTVDIPLAPNP